MEIWKEVVISDLKRLNYLEKSIETMQEEIENINSKILGGAYCMSAVPMTDGGCKLEDKYNNAIILKDKLNLQIKQNKKDLKLIKTALNQLSDSDKKILNYAYINRSRRYIETICQVFNIERSQAYRNIDSALERYITARYGV